MEKSLPKKPPPTPPKGKKPPPTPPKGGEYLCAHERIRTLDTFSDNFCKILPNLSPLLSEGSGEASFRRLLEEASFHLSTYLHLDEIGVF